MVNSVGKVAELLQNHFQLKINITSAEVLRLNCEGNIYLRNGEVDMTINYYEKALSMGGKE
jgi:hypothetical protein